MPHHAIPAIFFDSRAKAVSLVLAGEVGGHAIEPILADKRTHGVDPVRLEIADLLLDHVDHFAQRGGETAALEIADPHVSHTDHGKGALGFVGAIRPAQVIKAAARKDQRTNLRTVLRQLYQRSAASGAPCQKSRALARHLACLDRKTENGGSP